MLGAGMLLAPRPEAFLWFLIPTGLAPTVRLFVEGDEIHFAMGLLSAVYTLATLVTTLRIHRTVESSITLQFENQDLVDDLRSANNVFFLEVGQTAGYLRKLAAGLACS